MGADNFFTRGRGKTAKEAFRRAVDDAAWENGHGGYTGTIAEKHDFRMVSVPGGVDPVKHAEELMAYEKVPGQIWLEEKHKGFWHDKWGPAACVKTGDGEWLFFGSASC